jgi:hypothetical protein
MKIVIFMRIVIFKNRSILNKRMAKQRINHSILGAYSINQMGHKYMLLHAKHHFFIGIANGQSLKVIM